MKPAPDSPEAYLPGFVEPAEVIRLGKDEMNLAEFPIAVLADRVPRGQTSIEYQDRIFDEKSGKTITRKVTIKAPEEPDGRSGLPTAVDDDVILGLIQLTKMTNNFTSREVEFSRLELIRLLDWPDSGDSYRRLAVSLKRWLSVTLVYENAWRDNQKGAWVTKGFHILDNIEIHDTRTHGEQGELFTTKSKIVWNKIVFESFESGYLKSLDYGLYLKLRHQTSKRVYRFVSKRMYRGAEISLDLRDFAINHIGLSPSYSGNAGKLKEKLQPALEELEAVGFLEPSAKEARYQKDGKHWRIRLVAKAKPLALAVSAPEPPAASGLAAELIRRKVSAKVAADLIRTHPAEIIRLKIDVFDWMVARGDKRLAKSPEGYLVKSITDDYKAPKGFVSAAERQKQEEAKRQQERAAYAEQSRKNRADAAATKERELIAKYWDDLSPELKAAHDAEAIAQASEEDLKLIAPGPIKRIGMGVLRDQHTRRLLHAQGKLPLSEA